jgi:Ca2+-binding RTX toxin-like protein
MADYSGTIGNDTMFGGSAGETFDFSQGGSDTLGGGGGNDAFWFGATLDATDSVDGGDGLDSIELLGAYSTALWLASTTIQNIEFMYLYTSGEAHVHLAEGNIAADQGLTVNVEGGTQGLKFDASAIQTGSLSFNVFSNGVHLIGGHNSDSFALWGDMNRDVVLDGGPGGTDSVSFMANTVLFAANHSFRNIDFMSTNSNLQLYLADGNVAVGATLSFNGAGDSSKLIVVDAKKELDGHVSLVGAGGAAYEFGGGHLNDTVSGGDNNDIIGGGHGADQLTGGAGADRFIYVTAGDSVRAAYDTITDLGDSDLIDLVGVDADKTQGGSQHFTQVSAFDGHAGELTLTYDADAGVTWLRGDLDGDGKGEFVVRINGDHHDFTGLVLS